MGATHVNIRLLLAKAEGAIYAYLENLRLTGSANINGAGNNIANILTGNSGKNLLDGGRGADTLMGGQGNDIYVVDNYGDKVIEDSTIATEVDLVQSSISYTLNANVENLSLTGTAAINATGNTLKNVLIGNGSANILNGDSGSDTLAGGLGNDTYYMARGGGVDTLMEYDSTAGNIDVLKFLSGVSHGQLWFKHVDNNLEIRIIGTTDKVVIKDWYSGSACHVEQIKTVTGDKTLLDSNVEKLVTAMAALTPPPLGQTTLSAQQHAKLDAVIAANWS